MVRGASVDVGAPAASAGLAMAMATVKFTSTNSRMHAVQSKFEVFRAAVRIRPRRLNVSQTSDQRRELSQSCSSRGKPGRCLTSHRKAFNEIPWCDANSLASWIPDSQDPIPFNSCIILSNRQCDELRALQDLLVKLTCSFTFESLCLFEDNGGPLPTSVFPRAAPRVANRAHPHAVPVLLVPRQIFGFGDATSRVSPTTSQATTFRTSTGNW